MGTPIDITGRIAERDADRTHWATELDELVRLGFAIHREGEGYLLTGEGARIAYSMYLLLREHAADIGWTWQVPDDVGGALIAVQEACNGT